MPAIQNPGCPCSAFFRFVGYAGDQAAGLQR